MHTEYLTAQVAERRRQKVEDVRKRSEYRKAHGLDQDEGVLGGWTAKSDEEVKGPGVREDGAPVGSFGAQDADPAAPASEGAAIQKRPVKKWLGIW